MNGANPIFPMDNPSDIFEVLNAWVDQQPDALLYAFLNAEGEVMEQLSYRQFSTQVDQLAVTFQQQFATTGEAVLLAYQPGLEMITALFACNKAGLIGVPTATLTSTGFSHWQQRIQHLIDEGDIKNIALCKQSHEVLTKCLKGVNSTKDDGDTPRFTTQLQILKKLITTDLPSTDKPQANPATPCETFLIQYTSGSTSEPKGVEVSHTNLLANAAAVVDHQKPIAVSWLPQHHDMGLIGYYIDILLAGGCTYGFAPAVFIRRPMIWFETISRYRATASSAPNFALELCLHERRAPLAALTKLDLSSMRFLMVAAEPVSPQTLFAFLDKFSRFGLPRESLFVAYGLAEFTLAVTNYGRRALRVDALALSQGSVKISSYDEAQERVQLYCSDDTSAENYNKVQVNNDNTQQATTELMSCGKALADTTIRIIDPDTSAELAANLVGEIWLNGTAKAQGYRNLPTLNTEIFLAKLEDKDFLRTGDLGFLHEDELFICGRHKDMLIVHGRNIFPQDIETALQDSCPEIRRNAAVAFQPQTGASLSNGIVIAAELRRIKALPDTSEILKQLRETLQIPIVKIVLLPPKSMPRTSSGKVRRSKTREHYEQGSLEILASSNQNSANKNTNELDHLRQRYGLRGDEAITVFDAGIDSLDLVALLHWLQDQLSDAQTMTKTLEVKDRLQDQRTDSSLSQQINTRLFGIITIQQLFQFAQALQNTPEAAINQAEKWLRQAYKEKQQEEREWMLADRHCKLPGTLKFEPNEDTKLSTADSDQKQQPTAKTIDETGTKQSILVTGATGFLGIFLLNSLLQHNNSKIYVLVRGQNFEQARQRLRQTLISTLQKEAFLTAYDQRVNILVGDLEQPYFGLDQNEWTKLSWQIDTIYHNAALVNYLLDYQRMCASNVEGTRRILDFAFSGRTKTLNYISTTFIFGWASKAVLYEQDQNADMDYLDFGYSQSKWVAEQLVYSAMQQGLSARVFRPALITPALDGSGGSLDITTRLLAFMVKYGIGVDTQNQVSFMPVDVTSNNIVAIAQQPDASGQTFHVTRDQHETLLQITELIQRKTGITFEYYALKDFVPQVVKRCGVDDPLYPLLDFLVSSIDNIAAMEFKQYSNLNYQTARDKSAIGQQDATLENVVDGIISFLRSKDLLPCGEA